MHGLTSKLYSCHLPFTSVNEWSSQSVSFTNLCPRACLKIFFHMQAGFCFAYVQCKQVLFYNGKF